MARFSIIALALLPSAAMAFCFCPTKTFGTSTALAARRNRCTNIMDTPRGEMARVLPSWARKPVVQYYVEKEPVEEVDEDDGKGVIISNINYDGEVYGTQSDEYVEITNESKSDIDISGYSVVDLSYPGSPQESIGETFTFPPAAVLEAGQSVRVYTNEIHEEYGGYSFGSEKAIWNDRIGKGVLRDGAGKVISEFEYDFKSVEIKDSKDDEKVEEKEEVVIVEEKGDEKEVEEFVEDKEEVEIEADGKGVIISNINYNGEVKGTESDEYVEITNDSKSEIDISGYSVVDLSYPGSSQESYGETFTFPSMSKLEARQSVRVYTNEIHEEYGGYSFESGKAIWNDRIGKGVLRDGAGKVISEFEYP